MKIKPHHYFFAATAMVGFITLGQVFAAYPVMRSAVAIAALGATAAVLVLCLASFGNIIGMTTGERSLERGDVFMGMMPGAIVVVLLLFAFIAGVLVGG